MKPTALILIDIQNDYFTGGLMPLPDIDAAATNAARLLQAARQRHETVIHIRHIAASSAAPFFRPGTEGCEFHATVQPQTGERVVEKRRPNSFIGTELEKALRDAGIEHLTLCGAMSQMCIDATARAAVDLGFKVTVIADACAAADVEHAGTKVPAKLVQAVIMAPLAASYAKITATEDWLAQA